MSNADASAVLATVALVPSTWGLAMPALADVRGQADDRGHLEAAEKYAVVLSGAVVLGVAGVLRSPAAAVAGLIAVVGTAAAYRSARQADPLGA